jgi:hypothetical protein
MSFIKSRLRRAEASVRDASCAECSLPPNGPGRIVYGHIPEGAEEFCSRCGRPLWFLIVVDEGRGRCRCRDVRILTLIPRKAGA